MDMEVSLALFTIVPKSIIEELNEIQKKFLWSNKKCKIKHEFAYCVTNVIMIGK